MKKKIIVIISMLFLIVGCQTQEEILEQKEKARVDEITNEVKKNAEIPEEAKQWLIDNKSKKVLTIFCIKTSNRCNKIKENISEIEKSIKTYYIELDDLEDEIKDFYKKTYELNDYTGYLPYAILVNNNKLVSTNSTIKDIEDIKTMINENSK